MKRLLGNLAELRFVVPVGQLLRMVRVKCHEELLQEGALVQFSRAARWDLGPLRLRASEPPPRRGGEGVVAAFSPAFLHS